MTFRQIEVIKNKNNYVLLYKMSLAYKLFFSSIKAV